MELHSKKSCIFHVPLPLLHCLRHVIPCIWLLPLSCFGSVPHTRQVNGTWLINLFLHARKHPGICIKLNLALFPCISSCIGNSGSKSLHRLPDVQGTRQISVSFLQKYFTASTHTPAFQAFLGTMRVIISSGAIASISFNVISSFLTTFYV